VNRQGSISGFQSRLTLINRCNQRPISGGYALTNGHPPSANGRHASAGEIVASFLQKSYFDFASATGFT